jgi:hypothetical protein
VKEDVERPARIFEALMVQLSRSFGESILACTTGCITDFQPRSLSEWSTMEV